MRSARARLNAPAPRHVGRTQAATTLGAVLVGGASSRFGSDKASSQYQGRTMLDNALDVLSAAGLQHLTYVGGAPRDTTRHATHVPDLASLPDERCALRGVVSALHAVLPPLQQAVIIACDLPLLCAETVARLIAALDASETVVAHGERDHWSCVAFRVDALPHLEGSLARGRRAMHDACADLRLARVQVDESEFANVNTRSALDEVITKHAGGRE